MEKARISLVALSAAIAVVLSASCSSVRNVRPLPEGQHRAGISIGGPLFTSLGFPMPIPLISLDYHYGLWKNLTVGGALHVTPIIFGLMGMAELDAAYGILEQSGAVPAVTAYLNVILMTEFRESFIVLPELGAIASWKVCDWLLLYGGVSALFNFYPKTANLPKDNWVLPIVPVGLQFLLGDWTVTAEVKLDAVFSDNRYLVLHYVGLGDYGAIAPFISVSYAFGGK